MRLAARETKLK